VFIDANRNGSLDAGESSTTTDAAGRYAFDALEPGTYLVRIVQQPGYRRTSPGAGYRQVTVAAGDAIGSRNFGEKRLRRAA
jgi:hypothetical protein